MNEIIKKNHRIIFHVDMNSFYASVEMAYDSSLQGKPVAIAGNVEERKGIVVTCSYEARAFGVKTTMPLWEAKQKCPQLIVRKPNFDRYRKSSQAMFNVLREYTDLVEPVSIDEGYMDVTNYSGTLTPFQIAEEIQNRLKIELLLPCSIGIAPNKFLAKMASDMKKPMGITILRKRELSKKLWPMKVQEMHGIGTKTAEKLNTISIYTIRDLAKGNDYQLKHLLGINGERLKKRANGEDNRPVDPDSVSEFKSIGNSTTLPKDTDDERILEQTIEKLATSVSARMKRKSVVSRNIQLMIRYGIHHTVTRSRKLANPIEAIDQIKDAAMFLMKKHWNGEPVRLLGITAQELEEKDDTFKQLDLFTFQEDLKKEPLQKALQDLEDKYGKGVIKRGIKNQNTTDPNSLARITTSFQKDFLE
ncbi:DNA polymerase IV [Sutcliffiella rhizosphaerae]|uniref:DNA polymerase IV n=1 Tax=Sutcliffiella rhizosphaerae TaxID=2880967 RepID=A0ABM8YNC9_9BACI|nr:DNA polymerase IV [Sutcliffiella rhizosphaerae]CAG9621496.1 DNA polymerase IV [Sutcliffiella rhizosphaerae]